MSAPADPGPVAVEAARLLEAVQQWARESFGEHDSAPIATGAQECHWCPICQLVAMLRGERPEAAQRIAAAGSALLAALGAAFERPSGDAAGERVQRIDLDG